MTDGRPNPARVFSVWQRLPGQHRILICRSLVVAVGCFAVWSPGFVLGQPPALDVIFPSGGQIGHAVDIEVTGSSADSARTLCTSIPGAHCEAGEKGSFRLTIPAATPPGSYDVWAVGPGGVSAPRTFVVGTRDECLETEPNDTRTDAAVVPLDVVVNGRIEQAGDVDQYRFLAQRGQQVLVECRAFRIDSRLRAVLDVSDPTGRRIAVNRGYFGIDPLVAFNVPEDGEYTVSVRDLVSSGGAEHYYRLDIGTGPRVAFTVPNAVQRGTSSRVALYGWNLDGAVADASGFDRLDVDVDGNRDADWPLPLALQPAQAVLADQSIAFRPTGAAEPVLLSLTDAPVLLDGAGNHASETALEVGVPCEVGGQLTAGDERDWFAINAQQGEVLNLEAFGERIGSPVDLQLAVIDESGRQLALFTDELTRFGSEFPTSHLDPAGRWVCPADGRYFITVRNLIGGIQDDPRRVYRLSVRRADSDFHVVAVPQGGAATGLNVPRGGRALVELLAFRQRGMSGGIRVSARDLLDGVECPEVWLGPGVDRALLTVSASETAAVEFHDLRLEATPDEVMSSAARAVRSGTVVRGGTPNGWGRLTSQLPFAVAGDAPVRVTATADLVLDHHLYGHLTPRYAPGSVLDVSVEIERRSTAHTAPVRLVAAGLPERISNQTAEIPAGERQAYVSFYLPTDLAIGTYSLVIQAETTAPAADGSTPTVQVASNPVTFRVEPAAFRVEIDPFAVQRVHRGETFQVAYTVKRINGFIGKTHTELAAPGQITDVDGLRGRGETFVGQTDKGSLQIIVNDDAPLGPQRFLRLLTVGVVEDQPTYLGSCLFPLEIVE